MKKLTIILAASGLAFASCKKKCDENDLADKISDINSAAATFATDDSDSNCQALRNAYEDYLDGIEDCDGVTQATIDSYNASINALPCN